MTAPTNEQFRAKLLELPIPVKDVKVYGSAPQIMVTARSEDAVRQWALVLGKLCATVRPYKRSIDYNKVNTGRRLAPDSHIVWRVWATV